MEVKKGVGHFIDVNNKLCEFILEQSTDSIHSRTKVRKMHYHISCKDTLISFSNAAKVAAKEPKTEYIHEAPLHLPYCLWVLYY